MPEPMKGQTQEKWMSMCMGSPESRKSFPEQKQRAAVCLSKWRNRNKKKAEDSTASYLIPDEGFITKFLEKYPEYKEFFEQN